MKSTPDLYLFHRNKEKENKVLFWTAATEFRIKCHIRMFLRLQWLNQEDTVAVACSGTTGGVCQVVFKSPPVTSSLAHFCLF